MLTAGLILLLAMAQDPAMPAPMPPVPRPAAPPVDNPLAPAAQGLIECANPDEIAKTCRSLARYTPQPDGSFINQAEVLLVASEPVTISFAGPTRLKGNEVCGTLTTEMVKKGTLRYAGTVVPDKAAVQITPRILAGLTRAGVLDKEICTTQSPDGTHDGNGFLEKATIDGRTTPADDAHLVWIRPDAGYTVGPRNTPD
jgi:hypothetical protein